MRTHSLIKYVMKMTILEEETFEAYGYWPRNLTLHTHKLVLAACDGCGKIRVLRKGDYRDLCKSCSKKGNTNCLGRTLSNEHKRNIGNAVKGRIASEETKRKLREASTGRRHTEATKRKLRELWANKRSGANNPNWRGGKVKCICKICGKEFEILQCHVKRGCGKYCSYSCSAKGRMHNAKSKKTRPERIFEDLCVKHNIPFYFVGDGSLWIGNANPDFVHKTRKIVIEVFGDYWHSPLLNYTLKEDRTLPYRKRILKKYGYKLIVFWETDLKRKDAEAFVLNELSKHM